MKGQTTYLLDDELKREPRDGPHVVDLQVLGLVEAVPGREGAEQRVRALVQRHGAGGVQVGDFLGGVGEACVRGLEVAQALGGYAVSFFFRCFLVVVRRIGAGEGGWEEAKEKHGGGGGE